MSTPRKKLRKKRGDAAGWCSYGRVLTDIRAEKPNRKGRMIRLKAKRVRCPKCGRRMKAQAVDVEPFAPYEGEYWFSIPRHKVKPADQ